MNCNPLGAVARFTILLLCLFSLGSCVTPTDLARIGDRLDEQAIEQAQTRQQARSGEITPEEAKARLADSLAETKAVIRETVDEAMARAKSIPDAIAANGTDPASWIGWILGGLGALGGGYQTVRANSERRDRRAAEEKARAIDLKATDDFTEHLDAQIAELRKAIASSPVVTPIPAAT